MTSWRAAVDDRRPATSRTAALLDRVPAARWDPRLDRRVVAAMVVVAAVLRFPNLGRSYWIDEGISVGISSHHVSEIPRLLRMDGSPPGFYVLLHFWLRAFGSSPASTHLLPLLVSLALVPLAFWAGEALFGRTAGVAASALAATNPFLNWYSTETRMYTLVCALGLLALTFTVKAVRLRSLEYALKAVLVFAALLYTHNWGLYLLAVTAGVLLFRSRREGDGRMARAVGLSTGAVFVLYLPWLPNFFSQAGHTAAPWAVRPGIGDFFADPASMLGGTLGFLVVPLLVLGAWLARGTAPLAPREPHPGGTGVGDSRFFATVGVLTLALGWLAAQIEPSWTVRYLSVTLGPLLLASSGALTRTSRGRAVIASVCALCAGWGLVGTLLPNANGSYAKSNVAAVAAAARPYLRPGDLVVVAQTEQLAVVAHYLPSGLRYATPTGLVRDPRVVDWRDLVSRLDAANPCRAILPAVAALPLGAAVLEIDPLRRIGASGSSWSKASNEQVRLIARLLAAQPSLEPLRSFAEATSPRPFSSVVAELFVKDAGGATCP